MLVMTLMYSLLAIIIFVCKSIFLRNKKQTLISLSILLLEILLIFIFIYFLLPSRNLLSLLLGNAIFGGIFLILNLFIGNFDADIRRGKLWVNKSFSIGLSVVMITLLIAVGVNYIQYYQLSQLIIQFQSKKSVPNKLQHLNVVRLL